MKNLKIDYTVLPEEFVRRIESDLNKIADSLPDFFENNFEEMSINWSFPDPFSFLIGMTIGICEGGYCQAFQQIYDKTPSNEQIIEIRKIITRRKLQIQQGVHRIFRRKTPIGSGRSFFSD